MVQNEKEKRDILFKTGEKSKIQMIKITLLITVCLTLAYVATCQSRYGKYLNPFMTKEASSAFIQTVRGKRSVDCTNYIGININCQNERSCECNQQYCTQESDREHYCAFFNTQCPAGQVCYLSTPCPLHWTTNCRDIDECESNPCQNNATCINGNSIYTCECVPGYEGVNCEIDIDECSSNPCENDGTCIDHVNRYTCTCSEDYTGIHCETDMCNPEHNAGADVVFVLDASLGQGQALFEKEKQYVKDFVTLFPVGPNDFRFSVLTFSITTTVHFYLDTHSTNVDIVNAVEDIEYTAGPSYTGEALRVTREDVLRSSNGMRSSTYKYVIVLTNGLSSNITDTITQARLLKTMDVEVIAIGFGDQVSHKELIDIATHWTKVFPASNQDAVNSILQVHVMPTCPDCFRNTSDVLILMDASSELSAKQFYSQLDAIGTLVKVSPISSGGVHVSYARFAANISEEFKFDDHVTVDDVMVQLFTPSRLNQLPGQSNVSKALNHAIHQGFTLSQGHRSNARKIVLLLNDGISSDVDVIKEEATALKDSGVTLVTIGIGKAINLSSLLDISSDPAFVYNIGDDVYTDRNVLYSLVGSLSFDACELD